MTLLASIFEWLNHNIFDGILEDSFRIDDWSSGYYKEPLNFDNYIDIEAPEALDE